MKLSRTNPFIFLLLVIIILFGIRLNITIERSMNQKNDEIVITMSLGLHADAAGGDGEVDPAKKKLEEILAADPKVSTTQPEDTLALTRECSGKELELLQTLSQRRKELDQWTLQAKHKETVLKATEDRINKKLGELKTMREQITSLINDYDNIQDKKIIKLIKIYEGMKPKKAATLFEQLDEQLLIKVMNGMKEKNLSLILANVDPNKSKILSEKFARYQKFLNS